jgi:hypothetical protein
VPGYPRPAAASELIAEGLEELLAQPGFYVALLFASPIRSSGAHSLFTLSGAAIALVVLIVAIVIWRYRKLD